MSHTIEWILLLSCFLFSWLDTGVNAADLRVVNEWKALEFVFPNENARQEALKQNYYVPGSSVSVDVDVQYREGQKPRVFVTMPRFGGGIPMTLGTVDEQGRIAAYPDYSWHDRQGSNCDGLTSVYRIAIDQCNRLWVIDSGKIDELPACPPKLLAFDLATDRVVYQHIVNASIYDSTSLFITPIVDVRGSGPGDCANTFVYVADVHGFGLLVVDVAKDLSWRVRHRLLWPFPSHGTFTIDNESFDLMDGLFGMALSPYQPGKERILYFHALASVTENMVRTDVIRNAMDNPNVAPNSMTVFPEVRPNQAAAEAMDSNGIMYFGIMHPPSILCWNSATEYSPRNFHQLAVNQETLQFASGVKVIKNLQGEEELWVMTCSFQRVMTGTMNSNRTNFRIHTEKISNLLKDSPCLLKQ